MKPKSVAGITAYVKDIKKTVAFYKALGFKVEKHGPDQAQARLNWFWINFLSQGKEKKPEFKKEAKLKEKGAGLYLYMSVDDVDQFYKMILKKKLKPSSAPRTWAWGNREFALRDPDGYKLIFFKKV